MEVLKRTVSLLFLAMFILGTLVQVQKVDYYSRISLNQASNVFFLDNYKCFLLVYLPRLVQRP